MRRGTPQRHPGRSGALLELHPSRPIRAPDYQNPHLPDLPDFLVRTGFCRRNIPLLNFPPAQKPFLTEKIAGSAATEPGLLQQNMNEYE